MSRSSIYEIFKASFLLGLTSFGGPVAHLGYFREEYVARRKWMDEKAYADLVALCQFLPGPASSQVGMGIGLIRNGWLGGIAAWLGFTLPSALALALFAYLFHGLNVQGTGWIQGLKIAAVAIVIQAVWSMGKSLAPDRARASIAICTAVGMLLWSSALSQICFIVIGGVAGYFLYRGTVVEKSPDMEIRVSKKLGVSALLLFAVLLFALPAVRSFYSPQWFALLDSFYRSGSLVFGGGHVVLPLLEKEVVPTGWLDKERFLAGYGAAQAVPGPLFTFASYLGMAISGWKGAVIATVAIFLPAYLLIVGMLPFWSRVRSNAAMKSALMGVNASVVGILLAALYDPVWISAIHSAKDAALALITFGSLVYWKLPPWLVVALAAVGGLLLGYW
jgi:chromate transporter